ncbi:MAG: hypothetical protein Q9165_008003 [Trypethelium subeluteriae]
MSKVNNDHVIKHLQDNNHITWKAVGKGHYVDIPKPLWQASVANVTNNAQSNVDISKPLRHKRDVDGGDTGPISGYSGNVMCYYGGAQMGLGTLDDWIVDGCEALLSNTLPPLAVNALRVWNTASVNDFNGLASYIRFSTELLSDGAPSNTGLCQAAMHAFDNFCEGSSNTQGGEVTVGGATKYNMDPTDLDCNC